jgi:uncharacterized protein
MIKIQKQILFSCWLITMAFSMLPNFGAFGQDIPTLPNPPKLVNDFVGVLSSSEIQSLESKLVSFDDTTSNQIAVVVVKTVEPSDMNTFATKLGREWGIGHDGKNNGIVVLWATEDRKVYIATGYGLEGGLPDAYAKRIVDRVIIPYFKESRFYEGLNEGTSAIMDYTSGEFEAEANEEFPLWGLLLIMLLIIIIIKAVSKGGKGGGGMMNRGSSMPYTTYTGWGSQSGSLSGGGGFGGFGGGSFGGGGAGGGY